MLTKDYGQAGVCLRGQFHTHLVPADTQRLCLVCLQLKSSQNVYRRCADGQRGNALRFEGN